MNTNKNSRFLLLLFVLAVVLMAGALVMANSPASPAVAVSAPVADLAPAVPESSRQARERVESVEATPATEIQPDALAEAMALVAAKEMVLGNLYDSVLPSVVHIRVAGGQGSGFVWDSEGRIVTNNHVVAGYDEVLVTFFDGDQAEATVLGTDPFSDLAVIDVDLPAAELVPVVLAESDAVHVGQLAVALGNPFGLENTMTVGVVSALGRTINSGTSRFSIPEVIQTDAPINPGNSGGPLLDRQGRVIGINTQIVSETGTNSGIGFAVPVDIAKRVVPELIDDGEFEYAWLGISGQTVLPRLVEALALPEGTTGVLISEVTTDGPADQAGLRGGNRMVGVEGFQMPAGGDVIVGIDGQAVAGMDDLITYLTNNTSPGDVVELDILRGDRTLTLDVTLGERPDSLR